MTDLSLLSRIVRLCCVGLFVSAISSAEAQQTEVPEVAAKEPRPAISTANKTSKPVEKETLTVEEIRSLLDSIDPYLPRGEVQGEIDIFGSTSMDPLAHGWAMGFQKFHPEAKVIISAEGSETVFDRLAKNPTSIGMLSRPVSEADLEKLKAEGLKQPVAIQVAREALGVFVNEKNPIDTISYQQLVELFCGEDPEASVTWQAVGVTGELGKKPVKLIGRTESSGTRKFIEEYLFRSYKMRKEDRYLESNGEVIRAVEETPEAIAFADFRCPVNSVKRLGLRDKSGVIEGTEHDVLLGKYPITRPLTIVFDLGQDETKTAANREFAKYALAQVGQTQAILAGFFPFDPPTLNAELAKLKSATKE